MISAVQWLIEQLKKGEVAYGMFNLTLHDDIFQQAKQMERDKIVDELIGFQIYLNDNGLITNHDWDFEAKAKQYSKKMKLNN